MKYRRDLCYDPLEIITMTSHNGRTPLGAARTREYLYHIQFPSSTTTAPDHADLPGPNLRTLSVLIHRHLLTIPFENAALHFEKNRSMPIDLDSLHHRFVTQRKGGYCMQQNLYLYHILRELGFDWYGILC